MLESGEVKNLLEIAQKEGIDNTYVSRLINLTTRAPDIVDAILQDTMPDHLSPIDLGINTPLLWEEQHQSVFGQLPRLNDRPVPDRYPPLPGRVSGQ